MRSFWRFVLVNLIGLALLVAAWWSGLAESVLSLDRVYAAPCIGVALFAALAFEGAGKRLAAAWVGDKLPLLALVFTSYGVVSIVPQLLGADVEAQRWHIAAELIGALVANVLGLAAFGWVALVQWVCTHED